MNVETTEYESGSFSKSGIGHNETQNHELSLILPTRNFVLQIVKLEKKI